MYFLGMWFNLTIMQEAEMILESHLSALQKGQTQAS